MKIARLSLGLKFSFAVTTLIGMTMFGVASLIINFQKESLRQNMAESNLAMTRNLAHDAAGSVLVFDPLRLDELVNTVPGVAATARAPVSTSRQEDMLPVRT